MSDMKRFGKFLALTALSVSTVVAIPAAPAFAGGDGAGYNRDFLQKREWRQNRGGHNYYRGRHHGRYYRDHDRGNSAAALGLGLALGAVAGGVIASNRAPAYSGGGSLEPWTRDWYRYCDNKYRSFNAKTGTYRGFDGRDHFCNAP
jgi:BA14K-like protein